jgi:hypothetical protein
MSDIEYDSIDSGDAPPRTFTRAEVDKLVAEARWHTAMTIHMALPDDCCTDEKACIAGEFEAKFHKALSSPAKAAEACRKANGKKTGKDVDMDFI